MSTKFLFIHFIDLMEGHKQNQKKTQKKKTLLR